MNLLICLLVLRILSFCNTSAYAYVERKNLRIIVKTKRCNRKLILSDKLMSDEEMALTPRLTVRFTNTITGKDVVAEALLGDNLLAVGDANGVSLPRACRTGLCGSCTCELKDPDAIKTTTNPREGFATIRACSTKCFVPAGETEMVIDVRLMRDRAMAKSRKAGAKSTGSVATNAIEDDYTDPMARFSGNWEKDFRPRWMASAEAAMREERGETPMDLRKFKPCNRCAGIGRIQCYNCEGTGSVIMGSYGRCQCMICVGQASVACPACQGRGSQLLRSRN